MTIVEIKKIVKGSGKKHIIIGTCIFLFGAMFIIGSIVGIDPSASTRINNAVIIMGALIAFVGFIMVFQAIKIRISVNNETHPLIKSINNNDSDALIWAYAVVYKVKGDLSNMRNWNMLLHFKDGKRSHVELKNENVYNNLNSYLKKTFPKVELNYSDTIQKEMKEKYGFK